MKIGEIPGFGISIPNRLSKVVGDDRELFLKGKGCESLSCQLVELFNWGNVSLEVIT